ncbi:hypothetical protein NUACC21_02090 [Scytonema sp. NUACC21]
MNWQTPTQNNRRYDPHAIARSYRYRPWLVWGRAVTIIWSFAWFILSLKWDEWQNQEEQNKLKRASELRQLLTRLGPTFIKVGQALSTRPDLIRKDYLDELVKLQDQLPPFDNAIAYQIIESQLERSVDEIFSELSPNPVAAASLGQVYRGRLISGEEVAVKVQRPNLRPRLSLDLYLMRWAAGWISPWLPLNLGHDLTMIVDEFGTKLFEEIEYLNEARNAEKCINRAGMKVVESSLSVRDSTDVIHKANFKGDVFLFSRFRATLPSLGFFLHQSRLKFGIDKCLLLYTVWFSLHNY